MVRNHHVVDHFRKIVLSIMVIICLRLNQGVIECMKRRYRSKLLSEILGKMDTDGVDLVLALKQITIKDVIYEEVGRRRRVTTQMPVTSSDATPSTGVSFLGNSIANEETVNRRSSRIFSSTAFTKSSVITDDRPDRGSSWTFSRPSLKALTHFRTLLSLIAFGPYTSFICRRISAAETFLAVKNRITDLNEDLIQVADEQQENCNAELINDLTKLALTGGEEILNQDVQEWVTGDDDLENEYLSEEQIVESVVEEYENEEAEKSDDDTLEEDKISHEEARNALQTTLAYIEH
ncbi:hypothetical protein J6590_073207 [Homalodisca vitripennis]|nr:hypothetical protein J6590_073207 [Homalodisca vitripennis]